jgi:hypothetical protein
MGRQPTTFHRLRSVLMIRTHSVMVPPQALPPFDWKFTRTDLNRLLARIRQHDQHAPHPLAA